MTTETTIDFRKVEVIRERLGLSTRHMAQLLDVSRPTYYKWVAGGAIRSGNHRRIVGLLREILPLLRSGAWPPEGVRQLSPTQRFEALLAVL
ncbi:hypothetical protein V6O07_05640, partial [Arthrospira platensis SPKY2]